jgi:hypothetical protein
MKTLSNSIALFSNTLSDKFMEGGPLFMSLILICLVCTVVFLTLGFLSLEKDIARSKKMTKLASESSLLGLVIGFLGSVIGLVGAFGSIEAFGSVSMQVLAGGLKVSLITLIFGSITFILPRVGIIILRTIQKE